ncbi:MAG: efflux RND transporter permease subunit [Deltaproteobacteria bacterium]|nr:MAG: efflux RND transporter permease subunit [Deltaproteobacteria bacterium]
MSVSDEHKQHKGPVAWMSKNSVAANLLLFLFLLGGALSAGSVKQEVFPEIDLDYVLVNVAYPGASPSESEEIAESVEQAVAGIDGVEEITATAAENVATVAVKLIDGTDTNRALSDVKNAVDRITTMPLDAEEPQVSLIPTRRGVISLVFYGDVGEKNLRALAERARNDLKALPNITDVELAATRPQEVHIDVSQDRLRQLGMTMSQVAAAVRAEATELPAGGIKTESGEVLLRTAAKPVLGKEFEQLTVAALPNGARLTVDDIAHVRDAFAETDQRATFDGKQAVMVSVYRTADQTPVEVADAVKDYVAAQQGQLPAGVGVATWMDTSEWYRQRLDLMIRNMFMGFILVLVLLSLFLETRLAFWVTLGIPTSFLGSLLLMPSLDLSVNMLSMFAFIVTLGIVVDDAIVVGENIYDLRKRGMSFMDAAVAGARQVAMPVTFSVLTTVAAFTPMLFVPGFSGKFFAVIPAIVISVLMISMVESFFILPSHLSHEPSRRPLWQRMIIWALPLTVIALIAALAAPIPMPKWQLPVGAAILGALIPVAFLLMDTVFSFLRVYADRLLFFAIHRWYKPAVTWLLEYRYLALAGTLAFTLSMCGQIGGGRLKFTFMPHVESDVVGAQITLPFGAPVAQTEAVSEKLVAAAQRVLNKHGGIAKLSRGILSEVGASLPAGGPVSVGNGAGGHVTYAQVYLVPSDERDFGAADFVKEWRAELGEIPGIDTLNFKDAIGGPSAGSAIDIMLIHHDIRTLETAATELAGKLETFAGVKDIDPGFKLGKPQIEFKVNRLGESLGFTSAEVGRQVRSYFYGAEAKRQTRGIDEMKVMVRLPEAERASEHDLDELVLHSPRGGDVPFRLVAELSRGFAYTSIQRTNEQRTLHVTANLDYTVANANDVYKSLFAGPTAPVPALLGKYPGLSTGFSGERKEQMETMQALMFGAIGAILAIFALIAIPFRSFLQPIIMLFVIPPAGGAAILGHLLMGYDLSMISVMGMVALAGVVVNDSIVMVDAANNLRRVEKLSAWEAIRAAGVRRFRPIMLTSITTFGGLAPMIAETSVQARFLIPMAISLGFGVLITLPFVHTTVPAVYLIVEDLKRLFGMAPPVKQPPEDAPEHGPLDAAAEEGEILLEDGLTTV